MGHSGPAPVETAAGTVTALFRDHHGELVRLALLMVGDRPTAEDVVQDAYASVHARWHRLASREAALPYVRAAVLNGCRSVLRRRGIARRAGALHRISVRDEAPAKSAESEVILSEDRRQVLAALARLPRRRREVLVDNQSNLAVSPDGTKLALTTSAVTEQHGAYYSLADAVVVIDLRTGARTTWQRGLNRGNLFPTIRNLSWAAGGESLVFLAVWCGYPGPPKDGGLCSGANVPGGQRDAQVWSLPTGTKGGLLTSGRILLQQSARYPVIAQALADPEGPQITALVLSGPVTRYGVWQHLAADQISTATGSLLKRLYQKTGNLGSEGTPNAVWLTSDPAGRFFLVSYLDRLQVSVGWIEPGAFFPLPARLDVNATSIAW